MNTKLVVKKSKNVIEFYTEDGSVINATIKYCSVVPRLQIGKHQSIVEQGTGLYTLVERYTEISDLEEFSSEIYDLIKKEDLCPLINLEYEGGVKYLH